MSFKEKVVLVTGASSGIGAATAEIFAQKGANVVLVGRNVQKLQITRHKCLVHISEQNSKILIIQADIRVDGEKIISETITNFGRLDVLVNNAGISRVSTFMNSDINEFDMLMDTNFRSIYTLTKLALPFILKSQGNIVNVSSIAGLRAFPHAFNYSLTKAALDQFTKCLAQEFAPHHVRVNSVNPAVIETDLFSNNLGMLDEEIRVFLKNVAHKHPIDRIGNAYEVAKTISFLASDDASFITGAVIAVDGGRSTSAV